MSECNEFLKANAHKLTDLQKRQLADLHIEGQKVKGLIRHLKGELNDRPTLPRTLNAENFVETMSAFHDYFDRAREALSAMPGALEAKREYREKTFAVTSTICSDICQRNDEDYSKAMGEAKRSNAAGIAAARGFADEMPKEKKQDASDPTELARIIPKKIAVSKQGTFTVNRKTAVELFNKLHEALSDKSWIEHPENRVLVDFRSV